MPLLRDIAAYYVRAACTSGLGERGGAAGNASVEMRFRYSPDAKSLRAMVPAVIPPGCCSCCRRC